MKKMTIKLPKESKIIYRNGKRFLFTGIDYDIRTDALCVMFRKIGGANIINRDKIIIELRLGNYFDSIK